MNKPTKAKEEFIVMTKDKAYKEMFNRGYQKGLEDGKKGFVFGCRQIYDKGISDERNRILQMIEDMPCFMCGTKSSNCCNKVFNKVLQASDIKAKIINSPQVTRPLGTCLGSTASRSVSSADTTHKNQKGCEHKFFGTEIAGVVKCIYCGEKQDLRECKAKEVRDNG